MTVVRKTVTFTEQQDKWIKTQVESGEFTNDSEYLRSLVREDQAKNEKFRKITKMLTEGMESGVSSRNVLQIMEDVKKRLKDEGRI